MTATTRWSSPRRTSFDLRPSRRHRRRWGPLPVVTGRSQDRKPGTGSRDVWDRTDRDGPVLLALLGPVAVRIQAAAPVVPGVVACVAGGDDAPSQLQQQLLCGGPRHSLGGEALVSRFGAVAAQLDHQFFGFSARED